MKLTEKFFSKRPSNDKSIFVVISEGERLGLFALTFPILFESVMSFLLGTVNTFMLSKISDVSVSASGSANTAINIVLLFFSVVTNGSTVIICNFIGAKQKKSVEETIFPSIFLILAFSIVITPFLVIFAPQFMGILNLKGEILREAIIYFRIRMAFVSVPAILSEILALLRCFGFVKYTFIIGLITNAVNLLLNILVVYFPSYLPISGISGVAASSVAANFCGVILSAAVFVKKKIKMSLPPFKKMLSQIGLMLKIGLPSGISSATFSISQLLTTSFVAPLGDHVLAAKIYFSTILQFSYLFSRSTGSAISLLVGRLYGSCEMNRADKLCRATAKINLAVNFSVSFLLFLLRIKLLSLYTDEKLILEMSTAVFAVDMLAELARAIGHVYEFALKSVRDVFLPLAVLVFSGIIFGLGSAYVFAIPLGMGIFGCYVGTVIDELVRAVFTLSRWRDKMSFFNKA
ncbi:MAG: MATE family efflux transporter [Clostridia bacterium]|nr:MATE family efflux transporter [Clostridia bacterium]